MRALAIGMGAALLAACGGRTTDHAGEPTQTLVTGSVGDPDAGPCSLVGAWHARANPPLSSTPATADITFDANGTFSGTPPFTGTYVRDGATIDVTSSTGKDMDCALVTRWTLDFSPDCAESFFTPVYDECPVTRRYLSGGVVLTR